MGPFDPSKMILPQTLEAVVCTLSTYIQFSEERVTLESPRFLSPPIDACFLPFQLICQYFSDLFVYFFPIFAELANLKIES